MASGQQEFSSSGSPSKRSISGLHDPGADDSNGDGEVADDSLLYTYNQVEKKRRLTVEQVRSLEISFEVENKLEPERKVQLARDLGLQPRQVAIWFQNRRARWKTKQLERDYNLLKAAYESLFSEKEKLQNEIDSLNAKLHSSSKEAGHEVMKREKIDERSTDTTSFRDLVWQPLVGQMLSLAENDVKPKEGTVDSDQERRTSTSSMDAASSCSNGQSSTHNSLSDHNEQLAAHDQGLRSLHSPSCEHVHLYDAMSYNPKEVGAPQHDHKPGVITGSVHPSLHLLAGKDAQRFGSQVPCSPQISYRQQHSIIHALKMEDSSFQEESFTAPLFPLDEAYGWLWTSSWD